MNTRCTVCHHPQRAEIEQALVAGVTLREIGKRFDRSKTTIAKHAKKHVPDAAQKALDAANDRDVEAGDAILAEVEKLKSEARRLQAHAERRKDYRAALTAIRELTRLVELSARLLGELRDKEINVTNVNLDPETATRMAEIFLARRARTPAEQALVIEAAPHSRVR
jgi:Helix-turn-helix domain